MKLIPKACVVIVSLISSQSYADLNDVQSVGNVWELTSQSCKGNGLVANNMSKYDGADDVKLSKKVVLNELGFEFRIPQIGDSTRTTVKLNLNDRTRGVVDSYILLGENDLAPQSLASR